MPDTLPTYRSLQELLLEKWDSYRALLEDPTVYVIKPEFFLKPHQLGIDAIYHALSHVDSIRECNDILTDMMYILRLLLQRFEHTLEDESIVLGHMPPMDIADYLADFAATMPKPTSSAVQRPSSGVPTINGPDGGLRALPLGEIKTPTNLIQSNKPQTPQQKPLVVPLLMPPSPLHGAMPSPQIKPLPPLSPTIKPLGPSHHHQQQQQQNHQHLSPLRQPNTNSLNTPSPMKPLPPPQLQQNQSAPQQRVLGSGSRRDRSRGPRQGRTLEPLDENSALPPPPSPSKPKQSSQQAQQLRGLSNGTVHSQVLVREGTKGTVEVKPKQPKQHISVQVQQRQPVRTPKKTAAAPTTTTTTNNNADSTVKTENQKKKNDNNNCATQKQKGTTKSPQNGVISKKPLSQTIRRPMEQQIGVLKNKQKLVVRVIPKAMIPKGDKKSTKSTPKKKCPIPKRMIPVPMNILKQMGLVGENGEGLMNPKMIRGQSDKPILLRSRPKKADLKPGMVIIHHRNTIPKGGFKGKKVLVIKRSVKFTHVDGKVKAVPRFTKKNPKKARAKNPLFISNRILDQKKKGAKLSLHVVPQGKKLSPMKSSQQQQPTKKLTQRTKQSTQQKSKKLIQPKSSSTTTTSQATQSIKHDSKSPQQRPSASPLTRPSPSPLVKAMGTPSPHVKSVAAPTPQQVQVGKVNLPVLVINKDKLILPPLMLTPSNGNNTNGIHSSNGTHGRSLTNRPISGNGDNRSVVLPSATPSSGTNFTTPMALSTSPAPAPTVQMPVSKLKPTRQQQENEEKAKHDQKDDKNGLTTPKQQPKSVEDNTLKLKIDLPKLEIGDSASSQAPSPLMTPSKSVHNDPDILMTYDMEMNDVLTERMQHDLVTLTISIFSGLLHHADLIPKLPFAGSYTAEADKRILVGLLADVMFVLFHFFELLAINKSRFLLMVNQLIKGNIIYASIHCCVNIVTQVITSKSLSFLYFLIRNDDNLAMLMIQSYDLLSILYLRLKLMVNIELLRSIQDKYAASPLNNSSELALRLKPLQDSLKECHITPFVTLVEFYHQLFQSISNLYNYHYVDDEYIFELQSQVLFLIRYIQLMATQVKLLVADPTLDCTTPIGLTIVANRSLYVQESPLYINPSSIPPLDRSKKNSSAGIVGHGNINSRNDHPSQAHHSSTDATAIINSTNTAPTNHSTSHHDISNAMIVSGPKFVIENGKKPSQSDFIMTGNGVPNITAPLPNPNTVNGMNGAGGGLAPIMNTVGNNNLGPTGLPLISQQTQLNMIKYTGKTMLLLRPLLQLSVDLLRQIGELTTAHEEIPDIFLYRDNGILSTSIQLGVEYRIDRPMTSFSPGINDFSRELQDELAYAEYYEQQQQLYQQQLVQQQLVQQQLIQQQQHQLKLAQERAFRAQQEAAQQLQTPQPVPQSEELQKKLKQQQQQQKLQQLQVVPQSDKFQLLQQQQSKYPQFVLKPTK